MTLICSGKNVGENSVKTGLASAEALGVYRVCVCVCLCGCVPCVGRASFRLGNIGASFSRQGCINRQARHLFFSLHLLLFVLFSLSFFLPPLGSFVGLPVGLAGSSESLARDARERRDFRDVRPLRTRFSARANGRKSAAA